MLTLLCFLAAASPYTPRLLPAAAPDTQAYKNASLSSWGGSVVRDPADDTYHMFAAAFTRNCSVSSPGDAWARNSFVMHAVCPNATGPFVWAGTALGRWHHNPQVMLHSDGTWLLYTIGTTTPPPPEKDCRRSTNTGTGTTTQQGVASTGFGGPATGEFVQLHHSLSPHGPWTFLNASQNASNPGIFTGPPTGFYTGPIYGTNPAPAELPNGTMVVASHDDTGLYVQSAPSWRGPYARVPGHLFTFDRKYIFEDPYVWFDTPAQRWRCLLHQYSRVLHNTGTTAVGGCATSVTADFFGGWELQSYETPAYTTSVRETGGLNDTFARRERPKLMLGSDGEPTVLFTAVCPKQERRDGGPQCWTHAQPVEVTPPTPTPPPPAGVCDPSTFLVDTAYNDGVGLGTVPAASAAACCELCAAAEAGLGCKWFSWDARKGVNKCHLKADDANPVKDEGVTSGATRQ